MYYGRLKKVLIPLLLLSYVISSAFSESSFNSSLNGYELTFSLSRLLEKNKFNPVLYPLSSTASDQFAENISVFKNASEKRPLDIKNDFYRDLLIINITQEHFYAHQKIVLEMLEYVKTNSFNYDIEFLFTANDQPLPQKNLSITGINSYLNSQEDHESSLFLILDFSDSDKARIFNCARNSTSPFWLVKGITDGFIQTKQPFSMPQKLASLYRCGQISGDFKMNSIFMAGIPCIRIESSFENNTDAIKYFLSEFNIANTSYWESHYLFFFPPFNFKSFSINEKDLIIFLFIFAAIAILLLCSLSFSGKHKIKYINDFKSAWFVIPLTLSVSFFSLYLGQLIVSILPLIKHTNPVIQFGSKIIISIFVISMLFSFQKKLKIPTAPYIYGYFVTFIAILNIFIFSSIDLLLSIVFAIEYFIVYIFRGTKKLPALICCMVLMLIPILPYLMEMASQGYSFSLLRFTNAPFSINLIITLALFPFQMLWLRILLCLDVYKSQNQTPFVHIIKNTLAAAGVIAFISVIFIILVNTVSWRKNIHTTETQYIAERPKTDFTTELKTYKFNTLKNNSLTIQSSKKAVRYSVRVISSEGIPVLDSIYDYTLSNNSKTAVFSIPDYPPSKITIDFSSDYISSSQIFIQVYYEDEENGIITFQKEIIENQKAEISS